MSPPPITATRPSACGVSAICVQHLAGDELRSLGHQEDEWPDEVIGLAKAPERDARQHALANRPAGILVREHPSGESRAKDSRAQRVHGDAVLAPLTRERTRNSVNRGLRRAVRGVASTE